MGGEMDFLDGAERESGDPVRAVKWMRKAAREGVAKAQNQLGVLYEKGLGVQKSQKQSVNWYRRAAEQGHPAALFNMGRMCCLGPSPDYKTAFAWYLKSADQGNAEAQFQLGKMCEQGQGISSPDHLKAFNWYQEAAQKGNPKAQYALGVLYKTGLGVEKNNENASRWFHRADEKGSLPAWGALEKMKYSASA